MTQGRETDKAGVGGLIQGFVQNDPDTLKQFYASHFPQVRNYILSNSGSAEDAQDMFQEAMLATWLNLKQGRFNPEDEENLGAYVFRIAKFKWLDRLRSVQFKKVHRMNPEVKDNIADDSEIQESSDRVDHLRLVYATLDSKCKRILDMFYYDKKDLASIAAELGHDVGSIRTMKYRCMMKLRENKDKLKLG
ncbi:MAG: sigma-70 family RNA polymerase sigma factor [Flavobacteriales bacterium]|nr:sigma-70 family RNA polymerase sigma factor [Flavobacteriales bacterium]